MVDSRGRAPCQEAAESPKRHSQHSDPPLRRSALTVVLSPSVSPRSDGRRPSASLRHRDKSVDDDVTRGRAVLRVELDRGVAGLGFCIDGGKQSPTGDRPVAVKRVFRCTYTISTASR